MIRHPLDHELGDALRLQEVTQPVPAEILDGDAGRQGTGDQSAHSIGEQNLTAVAG